MVSAVWCESSSWVDRDRVELEVKVCETAHLPSRFVGLASRGRRPVHSLRYFDVVHPVEDPIDGDLALGAGQRSARANKNVASLTTAETRK